MEVEHSTLNVGRGEGRCRTLPIESGGGEGPGRTLHSIISGGEWPR